jgi:glycosyltransferase involved in cell wall biosynthesis
LISTGKYMVEVGSDPSKAEIKLTVLWICSEWPQVVEHRGGVARYAYRLATEVLDFVHLTVVTEEGGIPLPGATMLYIPRASSRVSRYYFLPFRLRKVVRNLAPDIVHAFGDDWALRPSSALWVRHFLGSARSEARSSTGLRRLNHYLLSLFEHFAARRADVAIGIGPESTAEFRCDHTMPPVGKFPVPEVSKTATPSTVFIGAFGGRKRGRLALKCVQEAGHELGRPVTMTVFGPEEDARNWPEWVEHRAGASDDQVRASIAVSWLLLSTSKYEGFGIPIFEALALQTRVVASANPGSVFQKGFAPNDTAFVVNYDEGKLVEAVVDQLRRGPCLEQPESEDHLIATRSLSEMGHSRYLIEKIYAAHSKRQTGWSVAFSRQPSSARSNRSGFVRDS